MLRVKFLEQDQHEMSNVFLVCSNFICLNVSFTLEHSTRALVGFMGQSCDALS